uniref:Ubiquitin-like-conjugating enzyme ATG3 n=1 Tax=Dugesia japonica TaxID=6161 RepID=A0A220XHQ4_DUGJA|nr:autophagy-related protein 3 [Dugesia japonica]
MHTMMQAMSRTALGVAEFLTPVLKESKFKETGVITPEEFVASGDFIVYHCPTWQWASGDSSKRKSFLPPDKQYLITRNLPCYKRVSHLFSNQNQIEKLVEPEDPDGGWVDAFHADETVTTLTEKASEMTLKEYKNLDDRNIHSKNINFDDDDDEDDEAVDMAAFMKGECQLEDDDLIAPPNQSAKTNKEIIKATDACQSDIVQTRTYDLQITYDKLYQTCRLWLCGYDEDRSLLTEEQMFEDFSQDHVKKTVTMEVHPHLPGGVLMASVHPCRQAEVMKKLIEAVAEGGAVLGVHQYIVIFLKFVQAVIPTIEYDYTRNFNM